MWVVSFYVPKEHVEKVKYAMFEAGAGRIGNYDCCSFECEGRGQFRPLEGSQPFIGQANKLEYVVELKVEMVCEDLVIKDVVNALKESHPYETPAYYAIKTVGL